MEAQIVAVYRESAILRCSYYNGVRNSAPNPSPFVSLPNSVQCTGGQAMIGTLRSHEVAVIPRAVWESIDPAVFLGTNYDHCDNVLVEPDTNRESRIRGDAYQQFITQQEVLAHVVDWVQSWSSDAHVFGVDAASGQAQLTDAIPAVTINLGDQSAFFGLEGRRYCGVDFDIEETNRHHHGHVHEYAIYRSALLADAIVNVPRLRTHGKAGMAASLANLIGATANKNLLPHYTIGTPKIGGDAYRDSSLRFRVESAILSATRPVVAHIVRLAESYASTTTAKRLGVGSIGSTREVIRSGNWWGNDTIWRTILDLNRIVLYAAPGGFLADTPQRQTFAVVDAVLANEGNGSETPDAIETDFVIAGPCFAAVDLVCAKLMGFNWTRIPYLYHVFDDHDLPIVDFSYDDIQVVSGSDAFNRRLADIDDRTCFPVRPHFGWTDWVEVDYGAPA